LLLPTTNHPNIAKIKAKVIGYNGANTSHQDQAIKLVSFNAISNSVNPSKKFIFKTVYHHQILAFAVYYYLHYFHHHLCCLASASH